MTVCTDIQAPHSPTRRSRGVTPARIGAYVAGGVGLALALGAVALTAPSTYGGNGGDSAYARPTEALQGQSLAAYVSDHQADRLARSR